MAGKEARFAPLIATLGDELFQKVRKSKVLMIGAGGIGCELIKNLVLSGFADIEIIDLDTIDVSNLNRQFLFRPRHVGQPKALVAREMALRFNPDASIVAHHANIKDQQFGLSYFKQFDVVVNALDNVEARRHVNRLCIATDKCLVEAGTTGFVGQVFVIKRGETACYECHEKPTQKVFPICTIRSTPDKPVHCIVWAKEAFKLLFGDTPSSMLFEPDDGPDKSMFMDAVKARPSKEESSIREYAKNVITALYQTEINKQLDLGKYKGAVFVPAPIESDVIDRVCFDTTPPLSVTDPDWKTKVWGAEDCIRELTDCVLEMFQHPESHDIIGKCVFDKDDKMAMRFVAAASNLRASVFGIALQSFHDAKGVAGNIIPAIATTNAIVAGQQVMELLKILDAKQPVSEVCRYTYCLRHKSRLGHLLQGVKLEGPVSSCFVCNKAIVDVNINVNETLFEEFIDKVLKKRLGFNEPTVLLGDGEIWAEGEDAEDFSGNLPRKLVALPEGGIHDGSMLSVDDFSQDMEVQVCIHHQDEFDEEKYPEGFSIGQRDDESKKRPREGDEEERSAKKAAQE